MQEKVQAPAKASSTQTPTSAPTQMGFQHSPPLSENKIEPQLVQRFAPAVSGAPTAPPETPPDLQTQLDKATKFGHNFGRVKVFASQPGIIQPKLVIGQPGDQYEQEADRVAAQVMMMPVPVETRSIQRQDVEKQIRRQPLHPLITSAVPRQDQPAELASPKPLHPLARATVQRKEEEFVEWVQPKSLLQRSAEVQVHTEAQAIQRKCAACEEESIQRKPLAASINPLVLRKEASEEKETLQMQSFAQQTASSDNNDLETQLNRTKGGGSPLSAEVRSYMEPRFGFDFSKVRIHDDSTAVQLNRQLGAQAFTQGQDIYFGAGKSAGISELTAHELTHVVQQTGGQKRLSRQVGNDPPLQGTNVHTLGVVYKDEGVNLRDQPLPGDQSTIIRLLPFNTKLFVDQEVSAEWYHVTLTTGEYGYVAKSHIKTNLPEPGAKLHKIKSAESAIGIAEQHYKAHAQSWGEDLRFYVNVLEFVNRGDGPRGIYKAHPDDSWENTQTRADYLIWIPSVDFAKSLKGKVGSGSITYEAWNTVKQVASAVADFILGGGAFIAGLLHGAVESLWDTLVGLKDLAVMVWDVLKSLFSGELLSDAQSLWNQISSIDVSALIEAGIEQFVEKWNHPDILKRWHFRGWLCGYAIAEIAMLAFSGGATAAVKGLGKAGKFSKILAKFPKVAKLAEAAKTLKGANVDKLRVALKTNKVLIEAHQWAMKVLKIPAEMLMDLSIEAIERLKTIPTWAQQEIGALALPAKRALLGCASPCKVNLRAIWRRLEQIVDIKGVQVRGFRNAGELIERVGNLRNRLIKTGFDDIQIGLRGSSVTGISSKGGEFRWLAQSGGLKASDVDFFFTSPKLERKLDSLKALFKPDGRLDPDVLKKHAPHVAEALEAFSEQTTQQLGRKANAILLRKSLADSLKSGEHIVF